MAEERTSRVRILRHVQGLADDPAAGKEILTAGTVVDVPSTFGYELVSSAAAEYVDADEKLVRAPLHPKIMP